MLKISPFALPGEETVNLFISSLLTLFRAPVVQGVLPGCFQLSAAPLKVGCCWLNLLDTFTLLLCVVCLSCKWHHSSVQ